MGALSSALTGVQDNLAYKETDDYITRTYVLPLLKDEATRSRLVEEHRKNPIGVPGKGGHYAVGHSEELARVLDKLRRAPMAGKYVIVCTKPHEEWRIGRLSGVRGDAPEILRDGPYASQDEAEHAVFLKRVDDLLAAYPG
jgi:branched-chain amino acid transport system permease protein